LKGYDIILVYIEHMVDTPILYNVHIV